MTQLNSTEKNSLSPGQESYLLQPVETKNANENGNLDARSLPKKALQDWKEFWCRNFKSKLRDGNVG